MSEGPGLLRESDVGNFDDVGRRIMVLQTCGCVGRKTEVNRGYLDHFNCSLGIVRRRRGTLLGDGRWMGNWTHRINYCRSCDRVSLEWLSRKARPAPLIFARTTEGRGVDTLQSMSQTRDRR
jgi:hypothetical protein